MSPYQLVILCLMSFPKLKMFLKSSCCVSLHLVSMSSSTLMFTMTNSLNLSLVSWSPSFHHIILGCTIFFPCPARFRKKSDNNSPSIFTYPRRRKQCQEPDNRNLVNGPLVEAYSKSLHFIYERGQYGGADYAQISGRLQGTLPPI
ncbi:hypothetical protein SK128_011194 [Halocaridina rubra]|uniref:Uncharacterized protein n=1 Tax=Halocaridina rubra TaxID=373956 RepID=A0AAN8ZYK1_HALRR